jgi:hypothetical protein
MLPLSKGWVKKGAQRLTDFLGLQAKQATELKMLLQLPDSRCWCHPDVPSLNPTPTESEYRNWFWHLSNRWELAGPPLLAGLLEGTCLPGKDSNGITTVEPLPKLQLTILSLPQDRALKTKTARNYFQFTGPPYVQTQLSGVVCLFSLNNFPRFPLCKNISHSISVVSPSKFSFCFHSWIFLTQPRKMSRSSYGLWSMWKILKHYSSTALFLLVHTEIKVQN